MFTSQFKNMIAKRMLVAPRTQVQTPMVNQMKRKFSMGNVGQGPSKLAGGAALFATSGLTYLMYKGH